MIESIDEIIPFSRRHKGETIRHIIRYDSGYLKDLFKKNDRLVVSPECLSEIQRLTKGHKDNWEKPKEPTHCVFDGVKKYGESYLYDFNDEEIQNLNNERLRKLDLLAKE